MAHVRSTEALSVLSGEVDALGQSSAPRSAATDTEALANLDQRIAAIADGIATLRAENRRRAAQNFNTVIGVLSEKIELLEAAQSEAATTIAPGLSQPGQPRPELHICKFNSIERGIADLVRGVHEARVHSECRLARVTQTPSRQAASDMPDATPTASPSPTRNQAFRRAFPKLMLGLALAIGFTVALQLGLSRVAPRPVAESRNLRPSRRPRSSAGQCVGSRCTQNASLCPGYIRSGEPAAFNRGKADCRRSCRRPGGGL